MSDSMEIPALSRAVRRIRAIFGRAQLERDLDDELAFHLEMEAAQAADRGASRSEAHASAQRAFGSVANVKDECRDARGVSLLEDAMRDLRVAVRSLRRAPAFTATCVVTLALGIGANTAIFSVVRGALLRPLPFPEPDRLVRIWVRDSAGKSDRAALSPVDIDDWRLQLRTLSDVGGYWYAPGSSGVDLTGEGEPQRLSTVFVTPGFFTTLGVGSELGRLPRNDEMVRGASDHGVVLSHGFWMRQFGGARSVINRHLTLDGESFVVIGVMPAMFDLPSPDADIYVSASTVPDDATPRRRGVRWMAAVGRLAPAATVAGARADMNALTTQLAATYEGDRGFAGATVVPLDDAIVGDARASVLVLMGAVAFVLLAACANLASLQLARASARSRELAVRLALGASRMRLVRLLLTESMVLAVAGGVLGVGLAMVGVPALLVLARGQLPRANDIRVDAVVLGFALAISLLTGVLFGLAPALRGGSLRLRTMLAEGARGSVGGSRQHLRNVLVVTEVALAVILVAGAGLALRSLIRLTSVNPGFRSDHLVVINFSLPDDQTPAAEQPQVYEAMVERAQQVPGVISVGVTRDIPFRGDGERYSFGTDLAPVTSVETAPQARVMHVSRGFFRTMGIPLLAGRDFAPSDRAGAPVVLIVSRALADQYFGGTAVGHSLVFGDSSYAIVGEVGDVRQDAIDARPVPMIYVSSVQNMRNQMNLIAHTTGDPNRLVKALEAAIRSVDPLQTITSTFTIEDVVHDAVARPRLLTMLLGLFAALGLILGALGVYGVLAYLVGQRRQEIGVRLALGAQPRNVVGLVIRRGLMLSVAGIAIGIVGALLLTRLMSSVLFDTPPRDPASLGAAIVTLLASAVLASWLPARRAARVDPALVLRGD